MNMNDQLIFMFLLIFCCAPVVIAVYISQHLLAISYLGLFFSVLTRNS